MYDKTIGKYIFIPKENSISKKIAGVRGTEYAVDFKPETGKFYHNQHKNNPFKQDFKEE